VRCEKSLMSKTGRMSSTLKWQVENMKISVGCDHRGFHVKAELLSMLSASGHIVHDFGCFSPDGVDYPDVAYPVATDVSSRKSEVGVLLDGNGMGMCMAANKVHGIFAAAVSDEFAASCAREQHQCNIICIACEITAPNQISKIVTIFLAAIPLSGRHARRIDKLRHIEQIQEPRRSTAEHMAGLWHPGSEESDQKQYVVEPEVSENIPETTFAPTAYLLPRNR
jgi:ribose 5-phosphate isomerase B